jgi:poly(A) polymerase Pap1
MFPNYALNRILEEFFRFYSKWNFDSCPVTLKESKEDIELEVLKEFNK